MAATKKTSTAGAGEAALPGRTDHGHAARPIAKVIPLPGALLEPVPQQRRRGRNPKEVAPLWRKRTERAPELQALRLAAQLEHATAMLTECDQRCLSSAADLKAAERAWKAAEARDIALSEEYSSRAAEVRRLKAEQAALLRALGVEPAA